LGGRAHGYREKGGGVKIKIDLDEVRDLESNGGYEGSSLLSENSRFK
jgi:hypothetical protein